MKKSKTGPSIRTLRQFGWTMLVGFAVLAIILLRKTTMGWAIASASAGIIFLAMTYLSSSGATLLYKGWMKLGETMGKITSKIILFLIFYAVLAPLAVLMRLSGRDVLGRFAKSRGQKSFWVPVPPLRPGDHQHLS